MNIDYIFPSRFFGSKKLVRMTILTECKMDLKFAAPNNIKFLKCLKTNFFSVDFWRRRNQVLIYLSFAKDLATSFNALNQTKWCIPISQEYHTGWRKKGGIDGTKQSWEIDILCSLVRKTKFDLILHVGPVPKNCC